MPKVEYEDFDSEFDTRGERIGKKPKNKKARADNSRNNAAARRLKETGSPNPSAPAPLPDRPPTPRPFPGRITPRPALQPRPDALPIGPLQPVAPANVETNQPRPVVVEPMVELSRAEVVQPLIEPEIPIIEPLEASVPAYDYLANLPTANDPAAIIALYQRRQEVTVFAAEEKLFSGAQLIGKRWGEFTGKTPMLQTRQEVDEIAEKGIVLLKKVLKFPTEKAGSVVATIIEAADIDEDSRKRKNIVGFINRYEAGRNKLAQFKRTHGNFLNAFAIATIEHLFDMNIDQSDSFRIFLAESFLNAKQRSEDWDMEEAIIEALRVLPPDTNP